MEKHGDILIGNKLAIIPTGIPPSTFDHFSTMMLPIDMLFIVYCIYLPFLILLYLAEVWTIAKVGTASSNKIINIMYSMALLSVAHSTISSSRER